MKKNYIAPAAHLLHMQAASMLAASIGVNSSTTAAPGDSWTRAKGVWDSTNWDDTDDYEEE